MKIIYCFNPIENLIRTQQKELSYICHNIRDINGEKSVECIEYYDMTSFDFLGYDYPETPYFKDEEHQLWEV